MDEIYKLHADTCKTLANPVRLKVINTLRNKEMSAAGLLEKIKIGKVTLSQHMAILVEQGVVNARREGRSVFYRLSDQNIIRACDIMRGVLVKNLRKKQALLAKIK